MSYKQKSYIRQFGNKQNFMETNIVEDISHLVEKTNNTPTYKVYTALLTQSGTDAPVATVLENTLGVNVTYAYDSAGQYNLIFSESLLTDTNHTIIASTGNQNTLTILWCYKSNSSEIRIESYDYGNLDLITSNYTNNVTTGNNLLLNHMIEIRVYN